MNPPCDDTLFQCLPLPSWVIDAQTLRVLAVNAAALAAFGHAEADFLQKGLDELLAAQEDVSGSPIFETGMVSPNMPGQTTSGVGVPGSTIWRLRDRAGGIGTFELTSGPITFGGRAAWLQVAHDLGRERRTEEALHHLERRYRDIVGTATEGVWIIDAEASTTFVNDTMARMMGHGAADMVGRPLLDFMDAHGAAITEDNLERRRRGVAERHEFCFRRRDSSELWVHMATHPMHDETGAYAGALAMVTDITEWRQMQEQLRRSEQDLTITLQSIADAVIATDVRGLITRMNTTAERMTGWTLEEAIGLPLREIFHIIDADTRDQADDPVQQVMQTGEIFEMANNAVLRSRYGDEHYIADSAAPIRESGGQIVGVVLIFSDVTEAYQARRELAATTEILERTSAMAKVGGWELDVSTMQPYWSPETCRIHEVDPPFTPPLDQAIEFYSPQALSTIQDALGSAINHGTPWDLELPLITAKGRHIWVRTQCSCVIEGGKVIRLRGTFSDITERKHADERLRESESRFRRLFENSMDGVMVTAPDGSILEANPAACQILGRTLEELQVGGRDLVVDTEDPRLQGLLNERTATGQVRGAFTMLRGDGTPFEAEATSSLYHGGDGRQLSSIVFRDISARVRDEERLRRTNRTLRVLSRVNLALVKAQSETALLNEVCRVLVDLGGYSMSWIGYAEIDEAKTVRVVSQAGDENDYLERSRILWDSCSEFGRGPTGRAIATAEVQVNQDSQQNPTMGPWSAATLARGYRSSIALPLVDASCTFGALTIYAKEAQAFDAEEVEALNELARNMSFGIAAFRTRGQRDAAEGANRAKSAFLANMSHEIRTPLNAIVGLNYLIRRDGVTPQQAVRLDKIESAGQHLLSIINDILDLSKIEAGQVQIETIDFPLSDVLDAVKALISETASAKGVVITLAANGVPMWLRGDPTRLRQALLNFAGNAVKFTMNGSIALRAEVMQYRGDDLLVRFSVTDTGIGLTAEQIPRLFQTFQQADASITRKFGGTGLGLAITKRLAELMQGQCGVESQVSVGSTFWFTAVLQGGQAVSSTSGTDGSTTSEDLLRRHHRGARILLAEDNEVNREVALAIMKLAGLSVDVATDGHEAVAMVSVGNYDLILMDMQMPRMGGLEATRAVRLLQDWELRPILALTANAFSEDRLACVAAGMNDFIAKPMNVHAMLSAILKWLDWAKPRTG